MKNSTSKAGTGIFLILLGVVLLLGNLNVFSYYLHDLIFSWPMILIAIGFYNFLNRNITPAIILFCVGGFFMISNQFPDLSIFWPTVLIVIGVLFFFKRKQPILTYKQTSQEVGADFIDEVYVFGGGVKRVDSTNFCGGRITAIFGGSELSLEKCELSSSGAVLDLAVIFGGSKIVIPRDWTVRTEVVSIFGGFSDKRVYLNDASNDVNKVLVIKGVTIFGGGELRNV